MDRRLRSLDVDRTPPTQGRREKWRVAHFQPPTATCVSVPSWHQSFPPGKNSCSKKNAAGGVAGSYHGFFQGFTSLHEKRIGLRGCFTSLAWVVLPEKPVIIISVTRLVLGTESEKCIVLEHKKIFTPESRFSPRRRQQNRFQPYEVLSSHGTESACENSITEGIKLQNSWRWDAIFCR